MATFGNCQNSLDHLRETLEVIRHLCYCSEVVNFFYKIGKNLRDMDMKSDTFDLGKGEGTQEVHYI